MLSENAARHSLPFLPSVSYRTIQRRTSSFMTYCLRLNFQGNVFVPLITELLTPGRENGLALTSIIKQTLREFIKTPEQKQHKHHRRTPRFGVEPSLERRPHIYHDVDCKANNAGY